MSLFCATESGKCKPKHCFQYYYLIESMDKEEVLKGGITFDFQTGKVMLDLKLSVQEHYKYSYNTVKVHLHHADPKETPNYSKCKGLGNHYDPFLYCGAKSEYKLTKCTNSALVKGAYEAGDITAQLGGSLKLIPGQIFNTTSPFNRFKHVSGLSVVVHADLISNSSQTDIIACGRPKRVKC